MTGMAGARGAGGTFAGNTPYVSRYPALHDLWEHAEDVCYALGVEHGFSTGRAYGWDEGFAAGYLMPDPPLAGTPAARALERAAVRDALCPGADTLADAVAAFLRDVERTRARRAASTTGPDPGAEHHNRHYGVDHQEGTHDQSGAVPRSHHRAKDRPTSIPDRRADRPGDPGVQEDTIRSNYGVGHTAQTILGGGVGGDVGNAGTNDKDDLLAGQMPPGARPARRSTGTWSR